jgi:drug/metabolite transporter (DMT)-like permease
MASIAPPVMTRSDWALIAALSVIWGGAFFFIEIMLRELPPNTMVLLRLSLAAPPLLAWLAIKGERLPLDARSWGAFIVLGAMNVAIPFILFGYGQVRISAGLASILNATTPLWGVLVAHFLTRDERATPLRVLGVLLGFAGVAVMLGADALTGLDDNALAQIACIVATLFYALASIYGRRMGDHGLSPMQIATGQVVAAALIMLPVAGLTEQFWALPVPGGATWMAALGLSLISTSLAYVLYFRLLASAGATNSLLITFLIPVTAILLGLLILGEELAPRQIAGMALIALGLVALDGRVFARLAPTRSVP